MERRPSVQPQGRGTGAPGIHIEDFSTAVDFLHGSGFVYKSGVVAPGVCGSSSRRYEEKAKSSK